MRNCRLFMGSAHSLKHLALPTLRIAGLVRLAEFLLQRSVENDLVGTFVIAGNRVVDNLVGIFGPKV